MLARQSRVTTCQWFPPGSCGKIPLLRRSRRLAPGASLVGVAAVVGISLAGLCAPPFARGQSHADEIDLGRVVEAVANLLASLAENSHERFFAFLETIELLDLEGEIDRFVGNPRQLNDSTAYKLSLLPFHIRYPIYQQLVRQMTRQDELPSRRIHQVSPEAVDVIALRLDSLADDDVTDEVRQSLLTHFNAREIVDLGFFALAQQPFFPDTDEGWYQLRRRIATSGAALAVAALVTGAAFDVGALGRSGTITQLGKETPNEIRLGWYGGIRKLGFAFHPQLRLGMTVHLPGVELAAGLAERLRPGASDSSRAFELAVREGWLNRLVQPHGSDAFFEAALRRVVEAGPLYSGERTTGRAGFFFKRDNVPRFRQLSMRALAEVESDFDRELRYAFGFGFEHAPTGLTTVVQASRTRLLDQPLQRADTRGGIFLAGTTEPLTQAFVQSMKSRARLVREEWDLITELEKRRDFWETKLRLIGTPQITADEARAALAGVERLTTEREERVARLGELLADYLESRRTAYAIVRWKPPQGDLYGPLDPAILLHARDQLFTRLTDVSGALEKTPGRIAQIQRRHAAMQDTVRALQAQRASGLVIDGYTRQLATLQAVLQRESEHAGVRLQAYLQYRDTARRVMVAARHAAPTRPPPPVSASVLRKVMVLRLPAFPNLRPN